VGHSGGVWARRWVSGVVAVATSLTVVVSPAHAVVIDDSAGWQASTVSVATSQARTSTVVTSSLGVAGTILDLTGVGAPIGLALNGLALATGAGAAGIQCSEKRDLNCGLSVAGAAGDAFGLGAAAGLLKIGAKGAEAAIDLAAGGAKAGKAGAEAADAERAASEADKAVSKADEVRAKPADSVPGGTCSNSFADDTPVLMADGSYKPISEIRRGDGVIATNPETGEQAKRQVVAVSAHPGELYDIEINDQSLSATAEHPFWSPTLNDWVETQNLNSGDAVLGATGQNLNVTKVFDKSNSLIGTSYNLTVSDLHTFHVGESEILVHNNDCGSPEIEWGKQEKHFPGHPNYRSGRSPLTANPDELVKKAGTGVSVDEKPIGIPGSKERIDFGYQIGSFANRTTEELTPTSTGIIHYSSKGVHIVPGRPPTY
jgi:hypothetical protein